MLQISSPKVIALALTSAFGGLASAQQTSETSQNATHGAITTTVGNQGETSQLLELTKLLDGVQIKGALERLPSDSADFDNVNIGLNFGFGHNIGNSNQSKLSENINLGLGLRDGDIDLSRASFMHSFSQQTYIGAIIDDTPSRTQTIAEAGTKVGEQNSLQFAIDELGNFRTRYLWQKPQELGLSLSIGEQDRHPLFNASINTNDLWVVCSAGEQRPLQLRAVWGDIPANRSDLYASFNRPGANDLSLFPDQTIRPSIGQNPAFGMLLAQAPDAHLGKRAGDLALDFGYTEDQVLRAKAVARLPESYECKQPWVALEIGNRLDSHGTFLSLEAGTKLGPSILRLRTEYTDRGDFTLGLMFSFTW